VSVQAFCETEENRGAVRSAGEDRRLGKAPSVGSIGRRGSCHSKPITPYLLRNVIILETEGRSDILAGLDELATVCDAGTRVA